MERFAACLQEAAQGKVSVKISDESFLAEYRMNPPATDGQIREAEPALGFPLPLELRGFYLRWNGGELLRSIGRWRNDPKLWFLSTDQIVQDYKSACSVYGQRAMGSIVLITEDGMGGWVGMLRNGKVIDCDHDRRPSIWRQRVITDSLEDFLVQFHQERGIFWFDRWA